MSTGMPFIPRKHYFSSRGLFCQYFFQHSWFIRRLSDSAVSEGAMGSNPRQLRLWHWLSATQTNRLDHIHTRLDLIHTCLDLILTRLDFIHYSARSHPHSARSHPHSARSLPYSARSHPHNSSTEYAEFSL